MMKIPIPAWSPFLIFSCSFKESILFPFSTPLTSESSHKRNKKTETSLKVDHIKIFWHVLYESKLHLSLFKKLNMKFMGISKFNQWASQLLLMIGYIVIYVWYSIAPVYGNPAAIKRLSNIIVLIPNFLFHNWIILQSKRERRKIYKVWQNLLNNAQGIDNLLFVFIVYCPLHT